MNKILFLVLALGAACAMAQPVAKIEAPSQVNIGDLVILDGGASVGDNHLWVIDERAQGRFLEIPSDKRIVFAIGTPGRYSFQLIVADTSAGISQAVHFVEVSGVTLPPVKPPQPPQPPQPEPEPEPPLPDNKVAETSRRGVVALNDPATASALKAALEKIVKNPPTTIERQRSAVQDVIASVLLARDGESSRKDWLNEWRIPVTTAIEEVVTNDNYIFLIEEVIKGFDGTTSSPKKPKEVSTIKVYGRDNCKYCVDWKEKEMPRLKDQGWSVSEILDENNPVPYFDVCINGRCVRHQGYLNMSQLKAIVEGAAK